MRPAQRWWAFPLHRRSGEAHMHHHGFRSAFLLALFTMIAGTALAQSTLDGTSWRATELAGKATPAQDPQHEAYLEFQAGRVSGSDGCNRITGSYQLTGDRVTFTQMAATQMACLNTSEIEGPFRDALNNASRLTVAGDRMELLDAAGTRLAIFAAARQASASAP